MMSDIQFIIKCCKVNPTQSEIEQIRSYAASLNSQQMSQVALLSYYHGSSSLVYGALQSYASDLLIGDVFDGLKRQNKAFAMNSMRMTAELVRIMRLFKENGIDAIALKGPILARLAYGNVTLRHYGDLDILIKPEALSPASRLLVERGYHSKVALDFLKNQIFVEVNYDLSFSKEVMVELHWRLFDTRILAKFNPEFIWAEYETVEFQSQTIKTLKTETLLIYLCIHGSKHAWERLQWITDLDRLIRSYRNIDWALVCERSVELEAETSLLLGLDLSNYLFDTPLPDQVRERIQDDQNVTNLRKIILSYLQNSVLKDLEGKPYRHEIFNFGMRMQKNWFAKTKFFYRNKILIKSRDVESLSVLEQSKFRYYVNRVMRLWSEYVWR